MANMSYCRFENTYHDFCDCTNELDDMSWNNKPLDNLSESEREYAEKLYQEAKCYIEYYEQLKANE